MILENQVVPTRVELDKEEYILPITIVGNLNFKTQLGRYAHLKKHLWQCFRNGYEYWGKNERHRQIQKDLIRLGIKKDLHL